MYTYMDKKEFKPISPRVENLIKGLFLVLISIVMAINVGKVARTITFVPLYLFGASYYLIALYAFIMGGYRIIKGKKFKFVHKTYAVGLFLLFLGIVFIVGFSAFKNSGKTFETDFNDLMNGYNSQLSLYYSEKFINVFDSNSLWAPGLLGVLIGGLVGIDSVILFLGIICLVLAFICFFGRALISRSKKKSKKEKVVVNYDEDEGEEEERVLTPIEEPAEEELEPAEILPGYESDPRPFVNENSGFDRVSHSLDEAFSSRSVIREQQLSDQNDFVPLGFAMNANPFQTVEAPKKEEPVAQYVEEPVEEEEINLIDSRPVEEEHQIDNSLVTAQPEFLERREQGVSSLEEKPVEVKPKKKRVVWNPPSPDILMTYEIEEAKEKNEKVAAERLIAINQTLQNFKIGARCVGYTIGPSITRFNIEYDPDVTIKSVERLEREISVRLGGVTSRFTDIIPGESYSGFEVPNACITTVSFKEVVTALPDAKKKPLSVAFGKDISGNVIFADYNEFPHLLVAGTTGSGKSIYVHSIISTLIMRMSPDDLKIVLVDPKKVEMTKYRDMPHLLCPIITEAEKAKVCLQKLVEEMELRYEKFAENPEISDIKGYNEWARENNMDTMPYILAVLDEYADLVDNCKEISQPVVSIAQKARSAGIHLLISTQRPSTNIITGVIKGNLPTHVALMTSSYTDSMTIIGEGGAEKLLGKGDMLVQSPLVSRVGVTRLQGCFIQNKEIVHIVNYLKEHYETVFDERFLDLVDHSKDPMSNVLAPGEVEKESSVEEENKYQSIKEWVMTQEFVSMSKIQRECSVGFNRAGRFFNRLQKEGVVSTTQDGSSKGCRVLVHDKYYDGDDIVTSDELIG